MRLAKHIVIVAGEESGDIHAANLVKKLLANHTDFKFTGIGGHHMQEAGVHLLMDLAQFGVTGVIEVFRHFKVIKKAFRTIQLHLKTHPPDLLILVDYPGFNLRLAKFAKQKLGIRILYYISPQIWAWKAKRINTIRENVDRMAVILPFEKQIYQKAGVPVSFVGNPLLESVQACEDQQKGRSDFHLPTNKRLIALLPGSRVHEIEKHMPILIKTAQILSEQENNFHFVIPIASSLDPELIKSYFV